MVEDHELIDVEIRRRKEVYHLVSEKDLRDMRLNSALGDALFALAAILFSASFAPDTEAAALRWVGGFLVAGGIYFYVAKWRATKELLESGEVEAVEQFGEVSEDGTSGMALSGNAGPGTRITRAIYGTDEDHQMDVTDKLRELLQEEGEVVASNRNFGDDPHPDVVKSLVVEYVVGDRRLKKRFREGEEVVLP